MNRNNMQYITLAQIKQQLRIDSLFADDDVLLTGLGDSAESFLQAHLNVALDDVVAENSGELPKSLERALLMLVSYLYDNDGSGETREIPNSFWILCKPWQNYTIA